MITMMVQVQDHGSRVRHFQALYPANKSSRSAITQSIYRSPRATEAQQEILLLDQPLEKS